MEDATEKLSWKIEHAELTHKGDLENQMYVVKEKRNAMVMHFL